MKLRRETTQTIWRTVVFAGAMLGAPACQSSKPAQPTTPAPASTDTTMGASATNPAMVGSGSGSGSGSADPNANPCDGTDRARGVPDDDNAGRATGRGFVLS